MTLETQLERMRSIACPIVNRPRRGCELRGAPRLRTWKDWKAMTMTISDNPSAKRITVQIPTASGDMIEAWVYLPEGRGPIPPW
jgi:hypothetical protein